MALSATTSTHYVMLLCVVALVRKIILSFVVCLCSLLKVLVYAPPPPQGRVFGLDGIFGLGRGALGDVWRGCVL